MMVFFRYYRIRSRDVLYDVYSFLGIPWMRTVSLQREETRRVRSWVADRLRHPIIVVAFGVALAKIVGI